MSDKSRSQAYQEFLEEAIFCNVAVIVTEVFEWKNTGILKDGKLSEKARELSRRFCIPYLRSREIIEDYAFETAAKLWLGYVKGKEV